MRNLRSARTAITAGGALAAAGAAWSLFEAQWVECTEHDVPIEGLPAALEGFRILHLSDLHLGTLSLGGRALDRAVAWAEAREPHLAAITGDLVTRRGGKGKLEELLACLRPAHGVYAILGNHDVDDARDPFTRPTDLSDLHAVGTALLRDDEATFTVAGARVQVVGVDPTAYKEGRSRPAERVDPSAELRILLCHYPDVVDRLPSGAFQLVLSGHLHGGQICLPTPWGKVRVKELRATYGEGMFETAAGALYVSRGLGTTFVPFRFLARPEVTMLTLRSAAGAKRSAIHSPE